MIRPTNAFGVACLALVCAREPAPTSSRALTTVQTTPGAVTHAPPYGGCLLSRLAHVKSVIRLKDRADAPRDADVDRGVTLPAMLAPGDDRTRFDERRAAEIEGWIVAAHVGGNEVINCFARDAERRDTHIDIALARTAIDTERVIVEVTPRWRAAMRAAGVDWSTDGLHAALVGRRVRVRGWLLYDTEHLDGATHNDPGDRRGEKNWRATAWEIHPVTELTILP